jgi:hypothetical protein
VGEAAVQYAGAYVAPPPAEGVVRGARATPLDGAERPHDRLAFIARDGRLFLRLPAGPAGDVGPAGDSERAGIEVALERHGDGLFLAPHPDWDRFHLRFERDDDGAVVALSFGPQWFAREGRTPHAAPAPDPSWEQLTGAYRSHDPWNPVFRVISRRGRLLMVAPWLYPADEMDLVPLPGGGFRVGVPEWLPDRLTFGTVIDGHATRAVYDGTPFYHTFT